jgi:hypothetical protein
MFNDMCPPTTVSYRRLSLPKYHLHLPSSEPLASTYFTVSIVMHFTKCPAVRIIQFVDFLDLGNYQEAWLLYHMMKIYLIL